MSIRLELCNADIKEGLFEDVMFLSLAETGAMGMPGEVLFYVKTGELYQFNYMYGDVDMEKVWKWFPPLANSYFGSFGMDSIVPEGWKYVNLGLGNHLIVNETVYEKFMQEFPEDARPSFIYRNWLEVARKILSLL